MRKRIAIFASGRGSNAEVLYQAMQAGEVNGEVVVVVSDYSTAAVLTKAQAWGVPTVAVERKAYGSKEDFEHYCLEPALEMRGVIKKQLCIIDPKEFNVPGKNTIPEVTYSR